MMPQVITPQVRQHVLKLVNAVTDLRPFGVVLAIDQECEVIRTPQAQPVENNFILIDIKSTAPTVSYREVAGEGTMAALNCTAAVVAGMVTFGSGAAAPFSGGSSLILTSLSWAATVATAASCGNSLVRTTNALINPSENQQWDKMPAYTTTLKVLDGVSLLGVGVSAVSAVRAVALLRRSGVRIPAALTGTVNRQEAARLTRELIKLDRPGISNGELKALMKSGVMPKRFSRTLISAGAVKSLKDSLAAGMSVLSSALDGDIKEVGVYIVGLSS